MNLIETPDIVDWPATHYVFIEKIGPFQETAPAAWRELLARVPEISAQGAVTGHLSLYKIEPNKMTYRAGVSLATLPTSTPDGLRYEYFVGGKYSRFVLTGPYSDLPAACGRVFAIVAETNLAQRDDFCLEHYVNDPRTTPEAELVTEILIPTQ